MFVVVDTRVLVLVLVLVLLSILLPSCCRYETDITAQMQKYQHLVELMRRERISRQYQQHNDEVALHDARTALVDSDASDSDSDVRTPRTRTTL